MKMGKRLLVTLLALVLAACVLPALVTPTEAATSTGLGEVKITGGQRDFAWPVPGVYKLTSCFLDPEANRTNSDGSKRYHYAIDIGATSGKTVVASYDGTVHNVGYNSSEGYWVRLKHAYKLATGETITLYTKYIHLKSYSVEKDQTVKKGEEIAKVGSTGTSASHLDFQILTTTGGKSASNSLDPFVNNLLELPDGIYYAGSCNCCKTYITAIKELYAVPIDPPYVWECTPYPTHATIKTTKSTTVKSLPCSKNTDASSEDIVCVNAGVEYEAIGLYMNTAKNFWYKVKVNDSRIGYIYAGDTAFVKANTSDITPSGITVPANHTQGKSYTLSGAICSTYSRISKAYVRIFDTQGNQKSSAEDAVWGATYYPLKGSALDSNTKFGSLPVGTYTYEVEVEYVCTYADTAKTVKTISAILPVYEKTFNVVGDFTVSCTDFLPAEGAVLPQATYNITGTVTSNIALGKIEAYMDNATTPYGTWTASNSTTKSVNLKDTKINTALKFAALTPGTHTITLKASKYGDSTMVQFFTRTFSIACTHSYNSGTVTTAPTCTTAGVRTYTCSTCGGTKTESVAATGHSWSSATCTAPQTCTECGTTTGSALGHNYNSSAITTAPTCTNTGVRTYTCGTCGGKKTESIAAAGHTEVVDPGYAPTCEEAGVSEGKHCSVCKKILIEQTILEPLDHIVVIENAVAPTCTESGLTEGKYCSRCGEVMYTQTVIPATGHTAGEPVKENETDGTYELVTYCVTCKAEISRETVTTHTHDLTLIEAKVPTYSTAGNTAYYVCECGKYFSDAAGENEIAEGSWVIAALAAGKDTTALAIKPTASNTPATLMLGADLKLSFNVAVKTTTAYDSIFLEITKLGVTTEVELYSKSSTNHTFRYTLAAPEMTAEMTVVVCGVKDGKVYAGDPITFTYKDIVVDKMNAFYNGTNEKNKVQGCALLANLLKYGEEAQKRFNISTDNLATAGLSDTYMAMINTAAPTLDTWVKPAKATYYLVSYTPMLQEQIKIAFTFAVPTYTSLEGYEVRIVQTKSTGVVTHTFGADVLKNTSATRIRCDFAIAGAEGRDNLAITLYKDGAAVSATVNTNLSALSQGKLSDALNPLLYAMMNYCDAAKAFFG